MTTLTLEPGVEVRFNANYYLMIGVSSGDPGALVAQGSEAGPIVFTSNKATPAPGDWNYIAFYPTFSGTCVMAHCTVEYGGAGTGAIYLYNAAPSIKNTLIRNSKTSGVYLSGTGCNDAILQFNTVTLNNYGVQCTGSAQPFIRDNNFVANTSYGLYNSSSALVTAENNWWGMTTGPNTGGDATYGNVDTDPWLGGEYDPGDDDNLTDTDGDGLPDSWEMQYFGNLDSDRNADPDGDGISNWIEYKLGTDPASGGNKGPGIFYEYDELGRIRKLERIPGQLNFY